MKLLILSFLLVAGTANAAPLKRLFQDVKLPTQQVIEVQSLTGPAATASTQILNGVAGPSDANQTVVTSFSAQPDVARNLILSNGGLAADAAACTVSVNGTNYNNHAINETFTFSDGVPASKTGLQAFKTVTAVIFPPNCEKGGFGLKWYLGYGSLFGFKRCLAGTGDLIFDELDGAKVSSGATVVQSSSSVEKNTWGSQGAAPNASHNFKAYFMQNYLCF